MKKRTVILAAAILFNILFPGCGSDAGRTGDTTAVTYETAPYYTDDLTYMLYAVTGNSFIEINGVKNEYQTDYKIPAEIDGVPVTAISGNAFIYAPVVNLILPDTLTTIKNGAFYNCAALTAVKIPDNVTKIEDYAFYCCTMLDEVTIPSKCADIGGLAFYNTPWFDSLTDEFAVFGDGVLLDYNGSGKTVVIPADVKSLSSAFYNNTSVISVTLSETAVRIGNAAFAGCISLTSAEIPDSVTYIGDSAFRGCGALGTLIIPSAVTYIGVKAFEDCAGLSLQCYPGSYAAEYAKSNGLKYDIIK